jgi:hypothetical protein
MDFLAIRKQQLRLNRICFARVGLTNSDCWCMGARDDGGHIPCGEAREPRPIDLAWKKEREK